MKGKNMKKLILAAAVLGLAGLGIQNAKASDLGRFLQGAVDIHVAALNTIADVVHDVTPRVHVNVGLPQPVYYAAQPAYYPPAPHVVYVPAPAPRVFYYRPAPVYYAPRVVSYRDRDYRDRDDRRDYRGDRDGFRDGYRR